MSYGSDIIREALLALGAIHRASLLACNQSHRSNGNAEEVSRSRVFGLRAYGNTLRLLPKHLTKRTSSDIYTVLIVLLFLTYFEV